MPTPDISLKDLGQDYSATDAEIGELFKDLKEDPPDDDDKKGGTDASGPGNEEDDDHDEDDERRGGKTQEELDAATPEAAKEVREKKRQDRLNQRQRQRVRIETLERELVSTKANNQELNQRLASLENVNAGSQYAYLERMEVQAKETIDGLKNIIAEASVKGDGVRVAEATHALVQVEREQREIIGAKDKFREDAQKPRQGRSQVQQLDQETLTHANDFLARHPWYKGPRSNDRDSRILAMLDNELTGAGWNARTPAYWVELEKRSKQYLAHRYEKDDANGDGQEHNGGQRRNRQPVSGSGSNSNSNGGGGNSSESYRVAPERVRAMKEAGIWDDPVRRAKMIKRYQDADRQRANPEN